MDHQALFWLAFFGVIILGIMWFVYPDDMPNAKIEREKHQLIIEW